MASDEITKLFESIDWKSGLGGVIIGSVVAIIATWQFGLADRERDITQRETVVEAKEDLLSQLDDSLRKAISTEFRLAGIEGRLSEYQEKAKQIVDSLEKEQGFGVDDVAAVVTSDREFLKKVSSSMATWEIEQISPLNTRGGESPVTELGSQYRFCTSNGFLFNRSDTGSNKYCAVLLCSNRPNSEEPAPKANPSDINGYCNKAPRNGWYLLARAENFMSCRATCIK